MENGETQVDEAEVIGGGRMSANGSLPRNLLQVKSWRKVEWPLGVGAFEDGEMRVSPSNMRINKLTES